MGTRYFIYGGLLLFAISMSRDVSAVVNKNAAGGKMAQINGQANIKRDALTHVPQRCLMQQDVGPCRASKRMYHFNNRNGVCEPFVYGGCRGNGNRFQTMAECTSVCTCALTPENGPCRGHNWRWFYSPADGCCRPFIYGGCGGNKNNYVTWTECSDHCGYPKAGSNWWKWGAESGNGNGGASHGKPGGPRMYREQDFVRDWFIWSLLNGGEGIEMEDLAQMVAAGHMLGQAGQGTGSRGRGMGSFGAGMFAGATRKGTFTPLGHVGSAANLMNATSSVDNWARSNNGPWTQTSGLGMDFGMGLGMDMGTGLGMNLGTGLGMDLGTGLGMDLGMNMNTGMLGSQFLNSLMMNTGNGHEAEAEGVGLQGTAFDVFRIIAELSSGELSQVNLEAVAQIFGALDQRGRVDFDVLAQRLVASLMSHSGPNKMGALRGVAELLGTVDLEGNINANMFLRALAGAVQRGAEHIRRGNTQTNQQGTNTGQGQSTTGGTQTQTSVTVGIIKQLQAGYLTPNDLNRLATMFGAVGADGTVNIRLLAQQMIKSLTNPMHGVSLADLRDLARSFNAFDINGRIDLGIFFKGLLAALGQLTPNGMQTVAETSAIEMHNIFRRIHSGTMGSNDLVGLAIRYGARESNGNINIRLLATRMIESLQRPTTSRDASLLRFVAQSLGALNRNGNIDVQLFIQGMVKALQSVVPGAPNSGWVIGTFRVPAAGGSAAMEMIRLMGNMATGNLKPEDLQRLASRYGAMASNGNVDINGLAQTMVRSLMVGAGKDANMADLKGIAMAFGALDRNGNIVMDKFMQGLMNMFQKGTSGSWVIYSSGARSNMGSQGQRKTV